MNADRKVRVIAKSDPYYDADLADTLEAERLRKLQASAPGFSCDPDYPSGASPEGNDGGTGAEARYLIEVLIGPCGEDEADSLAVRISDMPSVRAVGGVVSWRRDD